MANQNNSQEKSKDCEQNNKLPEDLSKIDYKPTSWVVLRSDSKHLK